MRRACIFLLMLTVSLEAFSQYAGQDVMIFDKHFHSDTTAVVYLKISAGNIKYFDSATIGYRSIDCKTCPFNNNSLVLDPSILWSRADGEIVLKLYHPLDTYTNGVEYRITNPSSDAESFYLLDFGSSYHFKKPDFLALRQPDNIPLFHNYLTTGQGLRFESVLNRKLIYGFYYSDNFPAALPPMASRSDVAKTMTVDSVFVLEADSTYQLNKEGLYFFQSDTNSFAGEGFIIRNQFFPELVKAEDLIDPFRYILKNKEYKNLKKSEDKKMAFDALLLELAPSPNRARALVKDYFFRVKVANVLYTTFKDGWKNDMGMIYIVFGIPDVKVEKKGAIIWEYNLPDERKLVFEFLKVKTLFTDDHYVLQRKSDYANDWFQAVEMWRSARFR